MNKTQELALMAAAMYMSASTNDFSGRDRGQRPAPKSNFHTYPSGGHSFKKRKKQKQRKKR